MITDSLVDRRDLAVLLRVSRLFNSRYLHKVCEELEVAEWHSSFLEPDITTLPNISDDEADPYDEDESEDGKDEDEDEDEADRMDK